MEVLSFACTFAAIALIVTGAPTYTDSEEALLAKQYSDEYHQYLREPRSKFLPQFVTPCAAANSLRLPPYGRPYNLNPPYNFNANIPVGIPTRIPPVPQYGFGGLHYRSADEEAMEPEMLAFSDADQLQHGQAMMVDHNPAARFGSILPPIAPVHPSLALHGPVLTSASGSAYGIFPNANVGGCSIPLLLSCSPSITSGHLTGSPGLSPVIGDSYRLAEEPTQYEQAVNRYPEHSEEMSIQHLEPVHKTGHAQQAHAQQSHVQQAHV